MDRQFLCESPSPRSKVTKYGESEGKVRVQTTHRLRFRSYWQLLFMFCIPCLTSGMISYNTVLFVVIVMQDKLFMLFSFSNCVPRIGIYSDSDLREIQVVLT